MAEVPTLSWRRFARGPEAERQAQLAAIKPTPPAAGRASPSPRAKGSAKKAGRQSPRGGAGPREAKKASSTASSTSCGAYLRE